MPRDRFDSAAEPEKTLYMGYCRVCDEDVVFAANSANVFVCPKCRNEMQLRPGRSIAQA